MQACHLINEDEEIDLVTETTVQNITLITFTGILRKANLVQIWSLYQALCDVFCYGVSDYWYTSGVWPQRRQSAVKWRAISREHDISLQYDLSQWAQEPHSFYKAVWHLSLGHFPLQGHTEDSHSLLTKYFKSYLRCENPWINGC